MNLRSWYLERPMRPIAVACRDFLYKVLRKPAAPMPADAAGLRDARDGDQRTNVLVELLPDGILVHQAGVVVFANSAAAEIHGAGTADRLVGMNSLDLIDPEARDLVIERRRKVEAGTPLEPVVRAGLRLDGTKFIGETRAAHFTWNGEPAVLVVVRDVSEREQAREVLRESESRIRGILDHVADSVITIDESGIIQSFNPAAESIFGYPADAVIGRNVSLLMPEPDRGRHDGYLGNYRHGGGRIIGVGPREVTARRRDGTAFPVELTIAEMRIGGKRTFIGAVRDITERKRADNALQDSEARYRDLIEGSALGIQIANRHGERMLVNRACAKLFGYESPEALMSAPGLMLVAEHDRERVRGIRDRFFDSATKLPDFEFDGLHKDGSIIPVHVYYRRIVWDGQDAVQRTFIDLTERKRAENALQASEARYRDLIEGSLLAVQIKGQDGNRVYVNQAFLELFGYGTKEEVYRQEFGAFVAPHHLDDIEKLRWAREIGDPAASVNELDARRKDGSVFPVQVFVRPIVWLGENAQHRTYIDLTERKQAEDALRASEAQLRLVTDNIPVQVAYIDRDHIIRFANQPYTEWYGISQQDIVGMHARDVRGNEAFEKSLPYTTRTLAGEVMSDEGVRRYADGGQKYFRTTRVPHFGDDGEVLGYFVIFVDLTEHHEREEQLRHAHKMEAVGQLTGGVAHDFNNLLTVILGNLDLLQDNLEDPAMSRMVKSAMDASSRGAELTQRLLAFSRKQALEPRPTDVDDLVAGMADLMQRSLGEPIEIEITRGDDLWQCEIDPAQLENAILNLAINARDAMPRGGKLTIGTANVTVGGGDVAAEDDFPAGEYVMISVADNGVGMSRKVVERAFEPFFTTKDVGEGSGLGLSMVYGFIKQSGGHVAIDSKPDQGATVKLYLQRSYDRRQAAEPDPEAVEPLSRGEKILVVEDDAEVRALIVELLAGLGYGIVEAANGRQAIEVLNATPAIDLLFTDVVLPGGISGADVAVEATGRLTGIKVLYASGYNDNVLARHGQLDPGVQFINKPFRRGELAQKVRAALDGAAA